MKQLILSLLLLLALDSQAFNEDQEEVNLNFEHLISTRSGRHFLLTTLLEKHSKPLSTPRYQSKIVFQLPSTLGGPLVPNSYPCCQLDNVPISSDSSGRSADGSGSLTYREVKAHLKKEGILAFKRGTSLGDFNPEAKKAVNKLTNYINQDNGEQRQFTHMLSVAATVKDLVNQDLFAKSMVMVFVRRPDVGNGVPQVSEILGSSFFPSNLEDQVSGLPISLRSNADIEKEIVIDWSDPKFATYPDDEPEKTLWYIREDPEMNSHHWFWHILFGDAEYYNKDELQDRRGELFWYLHNQVCNRYNIERLSNGMPLVEPFGPTQWEEPIPLGYDGKLGRTTVNFIPGRPDNVFWTGGEETTIEMKRRARELERSIQKGYMTGPQGEKFPLEYVNGRDEGIIPLGATIETDPLRTVNNETYGNLHNGGHDFMATAGLHQQLIEAGFRSPIGSTATECRDPLLYRWHAYVDGIFGQYKLTLPDYTDEELGFDQITLEDAGVYSYPANENSRFGISYQKNELFSHMENGDVGYFGLDGKETQGERIRVKYKRLNHSPFVYRFNVRNSGAPTRGMVRIFLSRAADEGTPTVIEMDKFIWNFRTGETYFERNFDDASSVPKKARSLYEIQDVSINDIDGTFDEDIIEYSGCGWPKHLLVPKGNPEGFEAKILVVISKLLPGDDAATTDWETVAGLSHILCGAPGAKYPDSRPMGFPFDRYRGFENIMAGRSNMKIVPVTIYHQEECRRDSDCKDRSGCNRQEGKCNSRMPIAVRSGGPDFSTAPGSTLNKNADEDDETPSDYETPSEGSLFFPEERLRCMVNNTTPKLKSTKVFQVSSVEDCRRSCLEMEGCAHFEWEGKKAKSCIVYTDIIFQPKVGKLSISGPAYCEKDRNKPSSGSSQDCWKKNTKPALKYIKTWPNVASGEKCQKLCQGENKCESVEWESTTKIGFGDCHAFSVQYVRKADSWSGPLSC